jgi:hypothetical protein
MPVRRAANPTNSHAKSAPVEILALLNVLSRAAKTMMSIPISRSASQKNLAICRLCRGPYTPRSAPHLLQARGIVVLWNATPIQIPVLHVFKATPRPHSPDPRVDSSEP